MITGIPELPKGQAAAYLAILQYWADNDRSPTVRELGEILHISSPNGIVCHLRALAKKGYIRRGTPGEARSIKPLREIGGYKIQPAVLTPAEVAQAERDAAA